MAAAAPTLHLVLIGELTKDDVFKVGDFDGNLRVAVSSVVDPTAFLKHANCYIKSLTTFVVTTHAGFLRAQFHPSWKQNPIFVKCPDDHEKVLVRNCQRWEYIGRTRLREEIRACLQFREKSAAVFHDMNHLSRVQTQVQLRGPDALFTFTTGSVGSLNFTPSDLTWQWTSALRPAGLDRVKYKQVLLTDLVTQPDVLVIGVQWNLAWTAEDVRLETLVPSLPGVCYVVMVPYVNGEDSIGAGTKSLQVMQRAQNALASSSHSGVSHFVVFASEDAQAMEVQTNWVLDQYCRQCCLPPATVRPGERLSNPEGTLNLLLDKVSEGVLALQTAANGGAVA
jgi:hypothetical protein